MAIHINGLGHDVGRDDREMRLSSQPPDVWRDPPVSRASLLANPRSERLLCQRRESNTSPRGQIHSSKNE